MILWANILEYEFILNRLKYVNSWITRYNGSRCVVILISRMSDCRVEFISKNNVIYILWWKVHLVGYNFVADNWYISIRLAVVAFQIHEITRNSEKIKTYSSSASGSSKVIDLGANRKRICMFLLVINSNFGRISYRFRDIDAFCSKIACFPTTPLFDAPLRGNPSEYLDETYPATSY